MDTLCVQFEVSLKKEGLLAFSALPLLIFGERMNVHNVSLHIFHSFKLLTAMRAMVHFSWFLEWVLGWYLVDLCHVSFEMLRRDGNLANATFDRHRYFWIASLAPSVFYKLLEISKFLRALLTAYSFSMSPQLMIPQ